MEDYGEWLTTLEASRLAGYHPTHIRLLVRSGEVEAQKWGRDWMIQKVSLLDYLARAETKGEKRGPKSRG